MKPAILFIILCLSILNTSAQISSPEAKAAYLLAEESFEKGEMKTVLQYLEEATARLGASNAKILYMQIMAQRELANTDPTYLEKLDSTIRQFENAPDAKNFNEEKVLEVLKLKLKLKMELEKKQAEEKIEIKITEFLKTYGNPDWELGTSFPEFKSKFPKLFVDIFKKALLPAATSIGDIYPFLGVTKGLKSVTVNNNRITGYSESLFQHTGSESIVKGKIAFSDLLQQYRSHFELMPVTVINSPSHQLYQWIGTKRVVEIYFFSAEGFAGCDLSIRESSFNK